MLLLRELEGCRHGLISEYTELSGSTTVNIFHISRSGAAEGKLALRLVSSQHEANIKRSRAVFNPKIGTKPGWLPKWHQNRKETKSASAQVTMSRDIAQVAP